MIAMPLNNKITEFDILINEQNQALLIIDERDGEADNPILLLDTGTVILTRNVQDTAELCGVSEKLRQQISVQQNILIVETHKEGVKREYLAEIVK